jgi:cystathionine gamma-synthase
MKNLKSESWLVSAARPEEPGEPLNVPLVPASNFLIGGERAYSRDGATRTWEALETLIGGLEHGHSIAFSSGMAAAAAVFDQLTSDSVVVLPKDCYQGVAALAESAERKGFCQLQRIPVEDTAAWIKACASADLIWLESPSNPLLTVADLATICAAPRKPGSILAVDNTFATPLNQRPLDLGADVSMQSATKFIGGHSDLLAGILSTASSDLLEAFRMSRTLGGATPGTLEAWLAVRGARTMALRLDKAQANAIELANYLEHHPAISRVRYPGLTSHPTHDLAVAQLNGFGTMISFDVAGDADKADGVCRKLRLIRHATSLGAVESTIERRAAVHGQEHLPESLLRLSVGVESYIDLQADLEQALDES